MRECLGWMANCSNHQSCPMNWLERSVTELPTGIACHVCGGEVSLVPTESEHQSTVAEGRLAAFPVVPPIALDAAPRSLEMPSAAAEPPPGPSPAPSPRPSVRGQWLCTLANGESIRVDQPQMVIGRSRTCDIVIPSAKVSRQHASLALQGDDLWIEDLGSANGVWHQGEKVTRTKVTNGDTFTISDETLLFETK